MASARTDRQKAIRDLVRGGDIRTQAEMVDALRERGFEATQATVSRDIADMGLQKGPGGIYAFAQDRQFQTILAATVRETKRAGNLLIVITGPGNASSAAAAIDAAHPDDILGCIAGDDTILVIAADEDAARSFQDNVDGLISKR